MLTKEVNMKNLTTIIIAILLAILPISAFAHGIHLNEIDGHSHSLIDMFEYYFMIVILLAALVAMFVVWRKNRG